jgi:phosphatidylcholine synthase
LGIAELGVFLSAVLSAWLVHLYTASGVVMGFIAAADIYESDYRTAFMWLAGATFIDTTDGILARNARVKERLPWFDGTLLDNIVDYVTYVFVPTLFVWRALLVPDEWSIPVCSAMLLSSAYGFSHAEAKTEDHFFTGFPSYWNIVVFYLWIARFSPAVNTVWLVALSMLVLVPIRYVYPSRTPTLRTLTIALGVIWGVLMIVLIRQAPNVSRVLLWASLIFPAYYAVLSLVLHVSAGRRLRHGLH